MNKLMLMITIIGLTTTANAWPSCGLYGDDCSATYDCCDGGIDSWCINGQCSGQRGEKGDICNYESMDDDCYGWLVCNRIGLTGVARCSECDVEDHAWSKSITWETDYDIPRNPECRYTNPVDEDCSCVERDVYGSDLLYARWRSKDDLGSKCFVNSDCSPDSPHCEQVRNGDTKRCFRDDGDNCFKDADCYEGEYCDTSERVCVSGATTTTTTTSTTTSTSTTTTLNPTIGYNCEVRTDVSASKDDGYEFPGYYNVSETPSDSWKSGGSLVVSNTDNITQGNYTAAFIFRNVNIPNGLTKIEATVFLKLKSSPASGRYLTHIWDIGNYEVNTGDLSNTVKPTNLNLTTHTGGETWIGIPWNVNTWYAFNVSEGMIKTLIDSTPIWDVDDNLTVVIPFIGKDTTDNFTFYSYDDGAANAPVLCINYTATTSTTLPPDCLKDEECMGSEWCRTWYPSDYTACEDKRDHYLLDINYYCARDHECNSGKCSAHDSNDDMGDYPRYSDDYHPEDYPPYNEFGECLPSNWGMDAIIAPSKPVRGEPISVFAALYDLTGTPIEVESCGILFEAINYTNWTTFQTAWAYSEDGNDFTTTHPMVSLDPTSTYIEGDKIYNYRTDKAVYVNSSVSDGVKDLWVECCDIVGGERVCSGVKQRAYIRYSNYTQIKVVTSPPTEIYQYDEFTFSFYHLDAYDEKLSGSTCTIEYNNTNYTVTEDGNKLYTKKLFATTEGRDIQLKVWCDLATYEGDYLYGNLNVLSPLCDNNVMDPGEEGVDCGGGCQPCDEVECLVDYQGCGADLDCCSGWCRDGLCLTATCYDGKLNGGEHRIDCGGPNCAPCDICIYDNDCASDGSSYCSAHADIGYCIINNCTVDTECSTREIVECLDSPLCLELDYHVGLVCDTTDNLCRYPEESRTNQTLEELGLTVLPVGGHTIIKGGRKYYVSNCDNPETLKFEVLADKKVQVLYGFNYSTDLPHIGSARSTVFAGGLTGTRLVGEIPELCHAISGFGGMGYNVDSQYARVIFTAVAEGKHAQTSIDILTFKHGLEGKVNVTRDLMVYDPTGETRLFTVQAPNRSIYMWVKVDEGDAWRNITDTYKYVQVYNHTQFRKTVTALDLFWWRINTSWGEEFAGRYGNPLSFNPLFGWDVGKGEPKLGFTFKPWMLWLMLGGGIVLAAAMLKIKDNRMGGGKFE